MSEDISNFFLRVKEWAKENEITLEDFVKQAIDVPMSVYYSWQKSPKGVLPSATYIYKMAQFMGVSVEWLISGKEPTGEVLCVFQKRIGKAFKSLDDFDKETIAENAESLARRRLFPSRPIRILETTAEN